MVENWVVDLILHCMQLENLARGIKRTLAEEDGQGTYDLIMKAAALADERNVEGEIQRETEALTMQLAKEAREAGRLH